MDPVTAVGAVTSIVTFAQVASVLSQSLSSLGEALVFAEEDLVNLAGSLSLFSSQLHTLSELLQSNNPCYSDEIYMEKARVMIQSAKLYDKIYLIVTKLRREGLRAKLAWVLREKEIQELIERLQQLNSTLSTTTTSLKIDLQLTQLQISSASLIERSATAPLHPQTLKCLEGVKKRAEFYALSISTKSINASETGLISSAKHPGIDKRKQTRSEHISATLSIPYHEPQATYRFSRLYNQDSSNVEFLCSSDMEDEEADQEDTDNGEDYDYIDGRALVDALGGRKMSDIERLAESRPLGYENDHDMEELQSTNDEEVYLETYSHASLIAGTLDVASEKDEFSNIQENPILPVWHANFEPGSSPSPSSEISMFSSSVTTTSASSPEPIEYNHKNLTRPSNDVTSQSDGTVVYYMGGCNGTELAIIAESQPLRLDNDQKIEDPSSTRGEKLLEAYRLVIAKKRSVWHHDELNGEYLVDGWGEFNHFFEILKGFARDFEGLEEEEILEKVLDALDFADHTNNQLPHIKDIICKVYRGITLKGAYTPWLWICTTIFAAQYGSNTEKVPQQFYDHILILVGMLARYVVMENLYVQSQIFEMQEEYNSFLLRFCKTYLQHLTVIMSEIRQAPDFLDAKVNDMFEQVLLADEECRNLTISIYDIWENEDEHSDDDLDSILQEFSEEEDISDATEEVTILAT